MSENSVGFAGALGGAPVRSDEPWRPPRGGFAERRRTWRQPNSQWQMYRRVSSACRL